MSSILCADCRSRTKPFSELGFAITRWNTRKAQTEIAVINNEMRPSYYFRPSLSINGEQWCLFYGGSLQSGIVGFGNTPEEAAIDFDKNWFNFSSK